MKTITFKAAFQGDGEDRTSRIFEGDVQYGLDRLASYAATVDIYFSDGFTIKGLDKNLILSTQDSPDAFTQSVPEPVVDPVIEILKEDDVVEQEEPIEEQEQSDEKDDEAKPAAKKAAKKSVDKVNKD